MSRHRRARHRDAALHVGPEMAAMMANLARPNRVHRMGRTAVDVLIARTSLVRLGLPARVRAAIDGADRLPMLGAVNGHAHTPSC